MGEIKKGCVLIHRKYPEVKVWIVAHTWPGDEFVGVALSTVSLFCNVGDTYSGLNLENWELTDEFYDVAEIVTKMQFTKMQKGEEE